MDEWLRQHLRDKKCGVNNLDVMESIPSRVQSGVHSTSVPLEPIIHLGLN